jgi:hypothetical protein
MSGALIYTIMPGHIVVGEYGEPAAEPVEMVLGGRRIILEPGPGGEGRIVRLISTDPYDYLDPRFQPGRYLYLPCGGTPSG